MNPLRFLGLRRWIHDSDIDIFEFYHPTFGPIPTCEKWKWKWTWKSLSRVQVFATPWTVACQSPCPWNSPGKKCPGGFKFFLHEVHHFPHHTPFPDWSKLFISAQVLWSLTMLWWPPNSLKRRQECIMVKSIGFLVQLTWTWTSAALLTNYMGLGKVLKLPSIAWSHMALSSALGLFHEKGECSYLWNSKTYNTYHME